MKYQQIEEKSQMVAEPVMVSFANYRRTDVSCAISGQELLQRLRPRIETIFKLVNINTFIMIFVAIAPGLERN